MQIIIIFALRRTKDDIFPLDTAKRRTFMNTK